MSTATAGTRKAAHSPFSVLLTTSLVSSLIMLDSNIVAITLPTIGRSLSASFTDIQWVISAYILTYAALLLAAGNYADLHGRKKAMLIGLSIFALASAICGLATSVLMLNLARAAQGIGGALLLTASLAIISHDFTGVSSGPAHLPSGVPALASHSQPDPSWAAPSPTSSAGAGSFSLIFLLARGSSLPR